MKTRKWTAAGLALGLLGWLGAGQAQAGNPAYLNIDVTIAANLSVAVNGAVSSTDTSVNWNTATPNQAFASASSATVTNDSGAQTEKWALSTNPQSIDNGVASPGQWTLSGSSTPVGADSFSLQAVFGSSNTAAAGCPAAGATDWNQASAAPLTASPVTYTNAVFADASLTTGGGTPNPDVTAGAPNGRMFAGSKRALCWRVIMPSSTGLVDQQNIQVIVTAQNP